MYLHIAIYLTDLNICRMNNIKNTCGEYFPQKTYCPKDQPRKKKSGNTAFSIETRIAGLGV